MSKSNIAIAALLAFLLSRPAVADVNCYGGGGDTGPGPMFKDVSDSFVAETNQVYTEGGVKDFIYFEKDRRIVYRNGENELLATPLGQPFSSPLTRMDVPLSRLVDQEENYILADGDSRMYDIKRDRWVEFSGPSGPMEHLFWWRPAVGSQLLFTLGFDFHPREQTMRYRLYNTIAGKDDTVSCSIDVPSEYRLAQGMVKTPLHLFPWLVFYREERLSSRQRRISFRSFTTNCVPTGGPGPMLLDIPSNVPLEDAYWFPAMRKIGFKFNAKEKNFAWADVPFLKEDQKKTECLMFSLDNVKPFFVSDRKPALATWSRSGKLVFYDLQNLTKARLMQESSIDEMDYRSLWLSDRGNRLFVAPSIGDNDRKIYELILNR